MHRYVLLMPQSRAHIVISANAGSYAMPKLDVDYPFGLRDAPADAAQLRRALAAPLVVLLGTTDTDPDHAALPRQPEAMAQGEHRLARGMNFFAAARDAAIRMKAPFKWELKYADGIGHSNRRMAIFAAPLLGGTNAAR